MRPVLPLIAVLAFLLASCGSRHVYEGPVSQPTVSRPPVVRSQVYREEYEARYPNQFLDVNRYPASTFSIDVDNASYSNVRRFLNDNSLPPPEAVRIEELVNYFDYKYPPPDDGKPIRITSEVSLCPWNLNHKLVRIGIKARTIDRFRIPPGNYVFLIDVSGSMRARNKLPLLKEGLKLLAAQLDPRDRISIVTYAGSASVLLDGVPGAKLGEIIGGIDNLSAGGSTAGADGLRTAYEIASRYRPSYRNNRIILATDGDFNVGITKDDELVELIQRYRSSGIFLTVLGFGTGNLKDAKMEKLADRGNGNYAYIDNLDEAVKVLHAERLGTLLTLARDVKLRVEFNPLKVASYRLIGYENRLLDEEDFVNPQVDAGEIGSGHTVTAFYEIAPMTEAVRKEQLIHRYLSHYYSYDAKATNELLMVRIRYREPHRCEPGYVEHAVVDSDLPFYKSTADFRFAAAVAEFGLLLRRSPHRSAASWEQVRALAGPAASNDRRREFLELVDRAEELMSGFSRR